MKGEKSISNKKINSKNMKDEYENSFTFPLEDKKEKDKSNTTNNNKFYCMNFQKNNTTEKK